MSAIAPVKPYFRYSLELKEHSIVVAYYCKFYGVQKGLDLVKAAPPDQQATLKQFIFGEMSELEQMKKEMGDAPPEDLKYTVENFVLAMFAKCDKEERTVPTITKQNALDFNRCSHFI